MGPCTTELCGWLFVFSLLYTTPAVTKDSAEAATHVAVEANFDFTGINDAFLQLTSRLVSKIIEPLAEDRWPRNDA